jgi:hypothetical protein
LIFNISPPYFVCFLGGRRNIPNLGQNQNLVRKRLIGMKCQNNMLF